MALTRAQYLAPGGSSPALAGQVQGVKQGTGITIAADGTISFNAGSATGVVTGISGGTTGLTFSGNAAGLWTMAGVLAVANGGTGSSTSSGSINNLLPSQTGNAGRVLSTDGTNVLWAIDQGGSVTSVNASGGSTGLTFSGGPITTSGTLTLGGVLGIANGGTGATTQQGVAANVLPPQAGNAGRYLTTDGSVVSWGTVAPGGVTQIIAGSNVTISPVTGTGAVTINATGGGGGGGLTGLQEIDDIAGLFDGSTLSFPITVSGGQPIPTGPGTSQLVIAVGGIVQTPGVAFTFDNATDTITFTSAPTAGLTFAGYVGGNADPITAITTSAPLSGGGTSGTVNIGLAASGVTAGSYTAANITVDAFGRVTAAANGSGGGGGTVTSITASSPLTGGTITTSGSIGLSTSGVVAGAYTSANITVDAFGRVTAAANGSGGGVTGVTVTAPITDTGTPTAPIIGISAATTGVLGAVQIGTNVQITAGGTISILDASDTQKGVIETATTAEAATGTSATLALTAATGVPKTPADMTGAALIPGGNDGARPGTPATGMLRYNNQTLPAVIEYYDGTAWVTLSSGGNINDPSGWFGHGSKP